MYLHASIVKLHASQDTRVKLTACHYAIYGGPGAKLEHTSADTIPDEQGDSFYLIRVRTDRSHLCTEAAPLKIIPG